MNDDIREFIEKGRREEERKDRAIVNARASRTLLELMKCMGMDREKDNGMILRVHACNITENVSVNNRVYVYPLYSSWISFARIPWYEYVKYTREEWKDNTLTDTGVNVDVLCVCIGDETL